MTPCITIRVVDGITGENVKNAELEISYYNNENNEPGKTETNKFGCRECEIPANAKTMSIVAQKKIDEGFIPRISQRGWNKWHKFITGISLIFGLTGLALIFKRKKKVA